MKPITAKYAHHPPRHGTERRVSALRVVAVPPEVSPVPLPILAAAMWVALVMLERALRF
jgi:hypothetical protein